MSPRRQQVVNDDLIEEYMWGGGLVVYVNNQAYDGSFERAIEDSVNKYIVR